MKKLILLIILIVSCYTGFAQNMYTVNNESIELKTEVEGTLDLLWNIFNGKYRYFVRSSDGNIQELKNTKNAETNKYQEEYKTVLDELTQDYELTADKVNLTLFSLKEYINKFNATSDVGYNYEERSKIQSRLGVFGGLTNQPFIENPNNQSVPFFGLEFEIFEASKLPRHALFFHFRHALEHDDFEYSSTQLAIGYRFRVINKEAFNFYGNLKMVTYGHSEGKVYYRDNNNSGQFIERDISNTGVEAPFILGIGVDVRITKNSFITLAYHDIYAIFIDNSDNFPIDFAIGYKINL